MANVYKKIKDGYISTECLVSPNGSSFIKYQNTLAGKYLTKSDQTIELNLGRNFMWYTTESNSGAMFAVVNWIPYILATYGFVQGKYTVSKIQAPTSYSVSYQGADKTYTLTANLDFSAIHTGYIQIAKPGTSWNRYIGAAWASNDTDLIIKVTKTG